MNKKDCYTRGMRTGYDIAKTNEDDLLLAGQFDDDMIEQFVSDMCQCENESFRQYTPFEIFANQINNSSDPDCLWAEYDNGVSDGVQQRMSEFKRIHKDLYVGGEE